MSEMGGMAMPGGWTMSMTWMRMPGQSWVDAGASFLAMWTPMMVAMMLPSLVPALSRYRAVVAGHAASRPGRLTALVGLGYFAVWTAVGVATYPLGAVLAAAMMRQPALARMAPMATGAIVVIAGALQLSGWKSRHLACWRDAVHHPPGRTSGPSSAWGHGVRLGTHCVAGCAALTTSLLAVGVMDLRAMTVVAAAVTAERLAPERLQAARVVGAVALAVGSLMILHGRALI